MADGYVGHWVFWKTVEPVKILKAEVKGQFGGLQVRSEILHMIGNPAEKNGEPFDPDYKYLHLTGYELSVFPPFQKTVLVSNQFGEETVELGQAVFLLMPAFKSHDPKLPDEKPKGPHFLCYQVMQGPTLEKPVKMSDQFLTQEVEHPRLDYLGVPVDKNGEGMWNEDVHLAMYGILPVELNPPITVYVKDQFQKQQQLNAMRSVFLGVPSKKTVL